MSPSRVTAPDWAQIDTVLLDMDGTLLDLNFDNHFWRVHVPRRYAEIHALSEAEAQARLAAHYARHAGTLAWYCLDFWGRELQLDIVALKEEVAHLIALRPDTLGFLQALRASGRRVALVTNAHPASVALKMRVTQIAPWFDATISSHALGLPKEHPEFWSRLAAVEPFDPARTLFADDSQPVLESARAHGIAHVVAITNPDSRQPAQPRPGFFGICDYAELLPIPARASAA